MKKIGNKEIVFFVILNITILCLFIVGPIALYLNIVFVTNNIIDSESTLSFWGSKGLGILGTFCLVAGSILVGVFSLIDNGRFLIRSFRGLPIVTHSRNVSVFKVIVTIIIIVVMCVFIVTTAWQLMERIS